MKRRAQPWLGTLVDITIADALEDDALNACFNLAFARIAEIHQLMSFHDPASDVSRINAALPGTSIEVHLHTCEVLRTALDMKAASDGLFDIGCAGQLVEWGYLPPVHRGAARYRSGQSVLELEAGQRVRKTDASLIDLGGIAKGYAVDQAVAALKKGGIRSACVNAGGDLRVFGERTFPVAIRDPRSPTALALQVQLRDEALATSGSYFSRKQIDAREVSALLNGRTGEPMLAAASASVRAPGCMLADALTKVVLASGDAAHPALARFSATAFIL